MGKGSGGWLQRKRATFREIQGKEKDKEGKIH